MHRDRTDAYERPVSNRGLSIAIWCALAIVALVLYSRSQSGIALTGTNHVVIGCLLAAFAGAVSLFAYVLSRNSGRVQSSGFWQLIEGMSTLIPPAVIAMTILPVTAEMRPWVLGLMLIVGCFGLISMSDIEFADGRTHKFHRREYLFDRGLGRPFLETIDVVDPVTNLPRRRRRRSNDEYDRDQYDRIDDSRGSRRTSNRLTDTPRTVHTQQVESTPQRPVVDGTLQQQISRFIARNGDDRVEAIWTVHFDRDQKRAVVHVPFSPAFASRPKVECSVIEGDGVTLKVAEVHPYGVRIEARRSQTERPADVTIGFHATAKRNATSRVAGDSTGQHTRHDRRDNQITRGAQPVYDSHAIHDGHESRGSHDGRGIAGESITGLAGAAVAGAAVTGEAITGAVAGRGRAVADTGRAVADSVVETGRSVTQGAQSVVEGGRSIVERASRVAKRAVAGVDPVFSLGNPADTETQPGDRISRTTGPHNPPGRVSPDAGSNSNNRTS